MHAKEFVDEPTPITYDTYIGAEVVLPKGNDMASGTVKSRVKDFEGQPIGKADKNPILDTRVFNVKFSYGENAELGGKISFQSACKLNVTLKVSNTGLWIILFTIGRITTWFTKISKLLQ